MFQRITINLERARKRYEMLDGKQYLVVPAVSLTVGVHNGSQGPLLYSADTLAKNPVTWNHKPVIVYHPVVGNNNEGITACDPDVVERQRVGLVFNTAYDGRLKHEFWLDEDKLRQVDERVLNAINNGEVVEVSTGLFHDLEQKEGEFNGERYVGIVHNMQPDHIAILPDQKGACSVEKGAGLLRNNHELSHKDVMDHLHSQLRDQQLPNTMPYDHPYIHSVMPKHVVYEKDGKHFKHNYKVQDGKAKLHGEPEQVYPQTSYMTANGEAVATRNDETQGPLKMPMPSVKELSDPMKRQQMTKALQEKYSGIQQEGDWGGWVTDIYANYVVYSKDNKHFRLPYTYDDDKIRFDGEPEEVERVSEYRSKRSTPIDGTSSPYNTNSSQEQNMGSPAKKPTVQNVIHHGAAAMLEAHKDGQHKDDSQIRTPSDARKEEVNKLISGGHWGEEYRTWLEGLDDGPFEKIKSYVEKGYNEPVQPYGYEGIKDRSNVHTAHNAQGPQRMTTQQYVANAPPEIRDLLTNALEMQEETRRRYIHVITSNAANQFTKEWLAQQPLPMLKGLASLAGAQQQTQHGPYAGQADVPMLMNETQPVQNAGQQVSDEDTLQLPVLSW